MVEVEPGGYLGTYRVVPGDNVTDAIVTGYLSDDSGNMARWMDPVGIVTIDTTPPESPRELRTQGYDRLIVLEWAKNSKADLAGHHIYRSNTPLTGFDVIGGPEFRRYKDDSVSNLQNYYFKISAVDRAGNESKTTDAVMGMSIAPGPTPLSGLLMQDTTWYAGASPYVLEGPVTIGDKAALTIEPGTTIQFSGSGLRVEGRFFACGNEARLIIFEGEDHKPWEGISFHNVKAKKSLMQFCTVRDANVGITCQSSAPLIRDCELVGNIDGIRIMGAFSEPEIVNNTIHKNTGDGLVVREGAKPTILGNNIRENNKGGALFESAKPVVVHNTVVQNAVWGVRVVRGDPVIKENNILDNEPYNMVGTTSGEPLCAWHNWLREPYTGRCHESQVMDNQ